MRSVSGIGRVAAVLAVVLAAVIVGFVLFSSAGGKYTVTAVFENGGQLVKGNLVQIAGARVGSVADIDITPEGQARITFEVDKDWTPLRRGTKAIVRQASLSGIANRYIDLQLPGTRNIGNSGDDSAAAVPANIPDGGEIGVDETTSAVDLDQVFNTFDPVGRTALSEFFKGSERMFKNRGKEANRGTQYLNPVLSTSSRFFQELNADTPLLEDFLVDSARFVTAVAERRDDLTDLISNLNTTFSALAPEREALAESLRRFPGFIRTANTTFANLRGTLDVVDPLVEASKPAAPKLVELFDELRPFAADARPTVRDLSDIIRRPGRDNDLIELNRTFPPLAREALDTRRRNGAQRRGAFPETAEALRRGVRNIAQFRAYSPDLVGWFDDFSTSGGQDALGAFSRTQVFVNAQSVNSGIPAGGTAVNLPDNPLTPGVNEAQRNLGARGDLFKAGVRDDQTKRCPGASEEPADDGSNVSSAAEQRKLDCRDSDRATGPFAP
jgi:phospholipid/cholesterol/gamma-HCH transport system substrate-binding protein